GIGERRGLEPTPVQPGIPRRDRTVASQSDRALARGSRPRVNRAWPPLDGCDRRRNRLRGPRADAPRILTDARSITTDDTAQRPGGVTASSFAATAAPRGLSVHGTKQPYAVRPFRSALRRRADTPRDYFTGPRDHRD